VGAARAQQCRASSTAGLASCGDSEAGAPLEDAGTLPDTSAPQPPDAGSEAPDAADPADASDANAEPPIHASITSFTASPSILTKGGSTHLTADFTGVSATIDQGVGPITRLAGLPVSPSASLVYTLTVTGNDGSTATATAAVAVYDHVFIVTTTAPSGAGSLADAFAGANALSGSTAITFSLPDPSTIELDGTLTSTANATMVGPGSAKLAIAGRDRHRLFFVGGGELTVMGVSLTHGRGAGGRGGDSPSGGGGGGAAGMGGAMFINAGTVTLKDLVVSDNIAQGGAGGPTFQLTGDSGVSTSLRSAMPPG